MVDVCLTRVKTRGEHGVDAYKDNSHAGVMTVDGQGSQIEVEVRDWESSEEAWLTMIAMRWREPRVTGEATVNVPSRLH